MAPRLPSLWCLLLLLIPPALAQITSGPQPASAATSARTSTRFYIQGGSYPSGNFGQFFFLDLAVPWNASTPAWTQLRDGPQQSLYPSVFSADQKTMITFHAGNPFAMRYNVASKQWSASTIAAKHDWQGTGAVTDPNTGIVYLAGGYAGEGRSSMDIYNFDLDTLVAGPPMSDQALASFPNRAYYGNVWCQSRKSILYFGGYNISLKAIPDKNAVIEFVPSSGSYSVLPTFGTQPNMRTDHCMASNDDGTLVVMYGGRIINAAGASEINGNIFILDITTQTWRKGTAGPPRVYTACTVAGDQFLMWGGMSSDTGYAPAQVMIYSLTNNNWVTRYTPPQSYVDLRASEEPQTSPGSSTGSSSSPSPGAIAGGVVGGVAIICIVALFFVFRRRRQHRPIPVKTTGDQEETPSTKPSPPPPVSARDEELERMRTQIENQQEQLELQRRLMQLQQQSLQMSQPMPTYQYQEPVYTYQPPIVYSAGSTSNPVSSTLHSNPTTLGSGVHSSPDTINSVAGIHYNGHVTSTPTGYSDGNNQYVEPHAMTPLVYALPPTAAVLAPNTIKQDGSKWDERPLGNPHAIIET